MFVGDRHKGMYFVEKKKENDKSQKLHMLKKKKDRNHNIKDHIKIIF